MSAATIKAAIATLLANNITVLNPDPPLGGRIVTQYRRFNSNEHSPRAVISVVGGRERRIAGGRGGLKGRTYRAAVHLLEWGADPDIEGPRFDNLVEDVLRLFGLQVQLAAADTSDSQVLKFAEEMDWDVPPPDMSNRQFILYQATIIAYPLETWNE